MTNHLKVLFSSQATKAWIAGLATALGAYLIPLISEWLANLNPEMVSGWLSAYGINVPYALVTVLITIVGIIWTYAVKNK